MMYERLNKREYVAIQMLAGILEHSNHYTHRTSLTEMCDLAIEAADTLLARLGADDEDCDS
jgi:hypothetical protein